MELQVDDMDIQPLPLAQNMPIRTNSTAGTKSSYSTISDIIQIATGVSNSQSHVLSAVDMAKVVRSGCCMHCKVPVLSATICKYCNGPVRFVKDVTDMCVAFCAMDMEPVERDEEEEMQKEERSSSVVTPVSDTHTECNPSVDHLANPFSDAFLDGVREDLSKKICCYESEEVVQRTSPCPLRVQTTPKTTTSNSRKRKKAEMNDTTWEAIVNIMNRTCIWDAQSLQSAVEWFKVMLLLDGYPPGKNEGGNPYKYSRYLRVVVNANIFSLDYTNNENIDVLYRKVFMFLMENTTTHTVGRRKFSDLNVKEREMYIKKYTGNHMHGITHYIRLREQGPACNINEMPPHFAQRLIRPYDRQLFGLPIEQTIEPHCTSQHKRSKAKEQRHVTEILGTAEEHSYDSDIERMISIILQ